MWEGIADLVMCLTRMADGDADEKYYLSSLDPGVGKTQTVIHFLNALLASPAHDHVGAVVFVYTKAEIRTLVREVTDAGVPEEAFAARVHRDDVEINELGCGDPHRARILFTTHRRLVTICGGRDFGQVAEFGYRNRPRQIRIWDESLLPAKAIALSGYKISGLYQLLPQGRSTRDLSYALDDFRRRVDEAEDKALIEVPGLAPEHKFSAPQAQRWVRGQLGNDAEAIEDLWHLLGNSAVVRHDGALARRLVSFRDHLPNDFAPLAILDASGRVLTSYTYWEAARRTLVRLKAVPKQYNNLTVHLWRIGGGSSSFREGGGALRRRGIVETIRQKLFEPWLIVCHKDHRQWLMREIAIELPNAKLEVIHWGMHRATNEYRDISNVILAGTMFLPPSALEGIGRAALALSPAEGLLTAEQERNVFLGEQANNILQAVCRGAARKAIEGECGHSDVYLIAHPRHGIAERLEEIFPGCRIEQWTPVQRKAVGKVAEALAYICEWLKARPDDPLRFTEVRKAIGGMDAANFNKLRKHGDFLEGLAAAGIEVDRPGRYARGFRCELEEPPTDGTFEDYFPTEDDGEPAHSQEASRGGSPEP
jgi:hypothetical protein